MDASPARPHHVGHPRASDVVRQTVVVAATCFMLFAAVVGTGLLGGTPVQELQSGALDADATLLAPARPAFSIWSAIYLLLIAYTVWQALPRQRAQPRQRVLGWWIALSAVLNGLWLVTAQFGTLPLTVIAIAALLVVLGIVFRSTVVHPATGRADAWLVDVTTGLHFGWVSLATVANTAAWLADAGMPIPEPWAVVVIAAVAVVGVAVGILGRGRFAPGLAMAWGLSWLAYGRLAGEPESPAVGIAAIIAAVAVLAAPAVMRVRTPARTRAASVPAP